MRTARENRGNRNIRLPFDGRSVATCASSTLEALGESVDSLMELFVNARISLGVQIARRPADRKSLFFSASDALCEFDINNSNGFIHGH
jgi:hypothetical protein